MSIHPSDSVAKLGLGLAAIGRPAYITVGRDGDLGDPALRSIAYMREAAHRLLDSAWNAGFRYIDVARSYGRAEQFLGSWLAEHPHRRADLTIGSKWGYEYVGDWRIDAAIHERKDHALAMFEMQWPESIGALGTIPDIYLIHSVTPDSPALRDTLLLNRLHRLADTGVRVGISTSGPHQAHVIAQAVRMADSPFSVVQTTWNLLEQSAGNALEDAHSANWLVVVKEVLANGRLTDPESITPVNDLAAADGQTVDAFAIGAALAQPWAGIVLTGAVTPQQLASNTAARTPRATAEQLRSMSSSSGAYWQTRSRLPWA